MTALLDPTSWLCCNAMYDGDGMPFFDDFAAWTRVHLPATVAVLLCVVMGFYIAVWKPSYGSVHLSKSMWLMPTSCNRPVKLKTLCEGAPEPTLVRIIDTLVRAKSSTEYLL
jgi:hypothetical protein